MSCLHVHKPISIIFPVSTAMVSALLQVLTAVVAAAVHVAAFDPNPLQDFCVADSTSKGLIHPSMHVLALTITC